ncbi:hypothetical protein LINPERPRIM_LOCUS9263 [Linum perenne]
MGFLLVFFPDSKPIAMKRTNSNNPILTKTQSTISICAFLFLFSFLLFALTNFEPPIPPPSSVSAVAPRRFLSERGGSSRSPARLYYHWFTGRRKTEDEGEGSDFALQGMGRIYRKGTRSMAELVVGHVAEDTTGDEFRLFLRLLHRSGVTSRADVVFLFAASGSRSGFETVIREENESFFGLLQQHCSMNRSDSKSDSDSPPWSRFASARFVRKANRKEMSATAAVEPSLWGKKIRLNGSDINGSDVNSTTESTQGASYGSVVGFDANELDPENSLSGFVHNPVIISLRRWACYPMLLGRVKRNFKHIILADVKSALILPGGDPLTRVRNRAPESVMYFTAAKHDKRGHRTVNPAVLIGGARGVRRFSSAMLTEIVRAAMQQQQQHKRKPSGGVTESTVLTRLLIGSSGEHILKNVKMIASAESITDSGALREAGNHNYSLIQRVNSGGNHMISSLIMRRICSCDRKDLLSPVYRDCYTELESAN